MKIMDNKSMKKVIVFIASVIVLSSCHKEIPKKQSIDIDISNQTSFKMDLPLPITALNIMIEF